MAVAVSDPCYVGLIYLFTVMITFTMYYRLPAAERRGYTSVFNALSRIISEEGLFTLWRGCGPTVVRAMVVNAAQLASYSQAKQGLVSTGKVLTRLNSALGMSIS